METETATRKLRTLDREIEDNFPLTVCQGRNLVASNTVIGSFKKSRARKIRINN